ncbi:MAG TPA: M56 family metallopeptidase [Chitinophagaceae bacterium]|nr:M56 family metallopeptidase [Chitinophagaceae bacterium]
MPLQLLQSLGWALLNSFWQMALLWVVYQLVGLFLQKSKATQRATLASTLLLTGFGWFVSNFITVYIDISAGETISSPFAAIMYNNWLPQSLPWISGLYLSLLLIPVFRFIRNYRYVQIIRTYGLSKIPVDWRIYVQQHAELMGIGKKVQIWVSDFVASPVTVGFLKPMILVPAAAINHLTPQQLEAVLLHELAHIRRYDYLLNLLVNIIRTILYFNPFVSALVKSLEREREKSCDEMVLQFQYNPFQYATALLTLQQTTREPQTLVLAAGGKKGDLLHRIEHIMGQPAQPVLSTRKVAGLLTILFGVIALNLVLLLPGRSTGSRVYSTYNSSVYPMDLTFSDNSPLTEVAYTENPVQITNEINKTPHTDCAPAPVTTPEPAQPAAPRYTDLVSQAYRMAGYNEAEIPELKRYQEAQVKEALEASRRVMEEVQWKEVEKSIADAFSEMEKKEIKEVYERELNKFNWPQLENKLKLAYAQIDWDQVNLQLNTALNQIRIDSLQRVYNDVSIRLNEVKKEMVERKISSIPDTDITLKTIDERKKNLQESLKKLKAIREKKIVSL